MARRWFLYLAPLVLIGIMGAAAWWLGGERPITAPINQPPTQGTAESTAATGLPVETHPGPVIHYVETTREAGIDFVHFDGATDKHYMMETMGSGVAWLDYDQDGLMDLFLVQGSTFVPPHLERPPTCKLYKNVGHGKFVDVTEAAGLAHVGCGMGVAAGDIDNDGYPDLFVTCYGKPNVLYHNVPDGRGGRRFEDVTSRAGLSDHPDWHSRPNFSTSAAFLDYNNDGFLDLFVCSYVKVDLAHYPVCMDPAMKMLVDCGPKNFDPTRCVLYRNNGDGTFTDVSHEAGIDAPSAKGLGVVTLDLDDDGKVDIFVANDNAPNFLFHNLGNGRFESIGFQSGCAVNLDGMCEAYMGVDADDLHGDGRPDLFSTAYSRETSTLWRNEGGCQFLDVTHGSGLGPPSWFMLKFGTCFVDPANKGSLDIVVANGHVDRTIERQGNSNIKFRQPAQLFANDGRGHFREISKEAGPYFQEPHVGRGLAMADYDNDGRMDLAFSNNGERAVLLHNETATANHWVRLELQGTKSNRDAIGARVTVYAGAQRLVRHRKGGGSYLAAHDPRMLIGLGKAASIDQVEVRWPSGLVQHVGPLQVDRGYRIVEGRKEIEERP
jgi:hypothetical protein